MIDPVTLSVLRGRLEQVADEMDATLFNAAFNPIIAEAHDASHGFYDAQTGDTLVQGKFGLPVFVGAMAFAVRAVIAYADQNGKPEPGDVFIFNDPYDGGTHLNDFKLVQPVFRGDEIFCYMASVAHWHDVGGNVPGNYNPAATEVFQEGVLIPPVKLVRKGEVQGDILAVLKANTRLPLSVHGDLNGQLAALKLGEERLSTLIADYGAETLLEVMVELRKRAAQQMKALITELPDGTYEATDHLDNDGISADELDVKVTITVEGDALTLDFVGTSGACQGPVNISRATAEASIYVALKHVFRDVAANAGVLDPVKIVIPEGCLLDARAPKPVGGYTETILRVIDVIFVALSKAAPERLNGCAYGTINALSIAGHKEDGARWVMFSFFGGGHGGHPEGDGLSHGNAPISMATIPPVEILESRYPVRFTQWGLREGSGGPGRHCGGLGGLYELEVMGDARGFLFGERGKHAPQGVAGGAQGALNRFTFDGPGVQGAFDLSPPMVSKMTGIELAKGQRVRLETPGGGGYGPPGERDPAKVAEDVADGLISAEDAREIYGVVLREDGSVDDAATSIARGEAAA
ncbi:hydantoinase B/oxoprolinase family protein [Thalassococcus sp. S3]|uniref:hydantoinase B/oxoprolinase family protein n=1 Tax=Thalassococcus sp. S3 TaxID=2017482 RepID=UPI0010247F57|nr:hydantoinase B/oxoprolinase family protein [Thalassococcus sp. S3]QBF33961.1 hydantoin utilization protein B [Thalassococcus sp. S3]